MSSTLPVEPPRWCGRLRRACRSCVRWLVMTHRTRRDARDLLACTESMLADLGMGRGEIGYLVRHGWQVAREKSNRDYSPDD